ncbi:MAG TPA: site-2 protease family protein [Pirellulales bacterium]|jgi:Zn-dependent protease|nr:site-2 protease family protein [Pirellulales bacterium]
MLLAEPPSNPWDLHFQLLGIPVRITPWFWLANIVLGWDFAHQFAGPGTGLNMGTALLIWTAAVLVSITVHEFGHALTYRTFGVPCHVVLYHFGGLAISGQSFGSFGNRRGEDPKRQILISVAGPLAQLLLAVAVASVFHVGGFQIDNPLPFFHQLDFLEDGKPLSSVALRVFEDSLMWCSVWWALLNLLPVYPLDGGRISREVLTLIHPREGIRFSLILSIAAAAGVALWALQREHNTMLALMFGMLAYSSFMTLQAYLGRGGGFGGGWR